MLHDGDRCFGFRRICRGALRKTDAELRERILAETKVNAVMQITVPAAEYKDDGDPTTLEIVFLTKKSDGPSRVSQNGEVIFLYKASDRTQQKLITQGLRDSNRTRSQC